MGAFDANNTATPSERGSICHPHCIFDIFADPEERIDLTGKPEFADLEAVLVKRVAELKATSWSTAAQNYTGNRTCITQEQLMKASGGFVGPLCYAGPVPGLEPGLSELV